jgi:hypothetical protein
METWRNRDMKTSSGYFLKEINGDGIASKL